MDPASIRGVDDRLARRADRNWFMERLWWLNNAKTFKLLTTSNLRDLVACFGHPSNLRCKPLEVRFLLGQCLLRDEKWKGD